MNKRKKTENIGGEENKSQNAKAFYTEDKQIRLKKAYVDFVRWTILTKKEKQSENAPRTQGEFARKWGIHIDTTTDWFKRPDFETMREEIFRKKLAAEVPEVMADLRKRISKYGMASDVELWLAYSKGWDRKKVIEFKEPIRFAEDDIRVLVSKLSKEKQKTFYVTIAKLLADARNAASAEAEL